ncbi:MAG: Immunoglobulin I-set domain protein [Paenibacillaceae bacterium]|nr:Immunoglobulin I-set domain protein [Paenibacillaceae bacterium]
MVPLIVLILLAMAGGGLMLFRHAPEQSRSPVEDGSDSAAESENAVTVTVDLTSTEYPALVRKIGLNGNWDFALDADYRSMDNAADASAVIQSGLIELRRMMLDGKVLAENKDLDISKPNSLLGPEPAFSINEQGAIDIRVNKNLLSLRQNVKKDEMINFVQLAGTPDIFTLDSTLKYKENGVGNWYPFPVEDQIPQLAQSLAQYASKVASADQVPTIWAFWQEPDHTIGGNLSKEEAFGKYLDFYKQVGPAVKAFNRDAVVAGIQQNATNGIRPNGKIDGAVYKTFADMLLKTEREDGVRYPLDYITIQNYLGEKTKDIVENSRIAFGDSRFNLSPVFMNEFDFNKDMRDEKYNKPDQVVQLMDMIKYIYEQPDVSYVLLKRNLFNQKMLAYYPIQFLGDMPALRRNIVIGDGNTLAIQGLASSNDKAAAILLWNKGKTAQAIQLSLKNPDSRLINESSRLVVSTMAGTAPVMDREMKLTPDTHEVPLLTLPAEGFLMIRIETQQEGTEEQPRISLSDYARHLVWVPRLDGRSTPPTGMGHYDIRSDSLIASVSDPSGVGLAAVILKNVPDQDREHQDYKLYANLSGSGLPAGNASTVVGLRVDYLDGDSSMQTVFYRDSRYTGAEPWPLLEDWLPAKSEIRQEVSLGNGDRVTLDIARQAPKGWAESDGGARRIQVSLILKAVDGTASIVAQLSDTP